MDAARIEEGKLTATKISVNLVDAINQIYAKHLPKAEKKGQKIRLFIDTSAKSAMADQALLNAVLDNILSNAIGFGAENTDVAIRLASDKKQFTISINDKGSFIPRNDREKIFTKFFRGENSLNSHHVGSGLGLYMVKAAVVANGGKIWFESSMKNGTTFYFTIPF
jgi:signal transduction histidine kinase